MAYSQDLIDEVKELYPNSKEMHKHANNGSVWLGRYLDDSAPRGLSAREVLMATDLHELQEKARVIERKRKIYKKWCDQDPRNK